MEIVTLYMYVSRFSVEEDKSLLACYFTTAEIQYRSDRPPLYLKVLNIPVCSRISGAV